MKAVLGFFALSVSASFTLHGEDTPRPDESIQALVRDSTLIIDAAILQTSLYATIDGCIVSYSVRVRSHDTIRGDAPAADVWVRLSGPQWDFRRQPAYLQRGQRCVFFLRPAPAGSGGFDGAALRWASAQPYSSELLSTVRRLTQPK
jgi:hypothetical protein